MKCHDESDGHGKCGNVSGCIELRPGIRPLIKILSICMLAGVLVAFSCCKAIAVMPDQTIFSLLPDSTETIMVATGHWMRFAFMGQEFVSEALKARPLAMVITSSRNFTSSTADETLVFLVLAQDFTIGHEPGYKWSVLQGHRVQTLAYTFEWPYQRKRTFYLAQFTPRIVLFSADKHVICEALRKHSPAFPNEFSSLLNQVDSRSRFWAIRRVVPMYWGSTVQEYARQPDLDVSMTIAEQSDDVIHIRFSGVKPGPWYDQNLAPIAGRYHVQVGEAGVFQFDLPFDPTNASTSMQDLIQNTNNWSTLMRVLGFWLISG